MAAPLSPERKAKLERDLRRRKATPSVGDYARKHGVSKETVVRYARNLGVDFGETKRSATQNAAAQRRASSKDRLEGIRERMLIETDLLLDLLHQPHLVWNFGGRDNEYNEHLHDEPDLQAKRAIWTMAAITVDKCAVIERMSTGGGEHAASQFATWLASVADPVGEYDVAGIS